MTEAEFRQRRRQKFLTEKYFSLNWAMEVDNIASKSEAIAQRRIPISNAAFSALPGGAFKSALKLVRLRYTSGDPIESLKPLYADALHWFDEWHVAYRAYIAHLARESGDDLRTDGTPARFVAPFQAVPQTSVRSPHTRPLRGPSMDSRTALACALKPSRTTTARSRRTTTP